jgi:DNA-binding PadR family transcriptional regulator
MARRNRSNLLALAVLCTLAEKPTHPYDIAQTLRTRAKHETVRLNYGSLYNVVEALERDGLIEARETVRQGRRPERTVYALTDAGLGELADWLSDLVGTPVREFPAFMAALSFLGGLPPDEAVELLRSRAGSLLVEVEEVRGALRAAGEMGVPRLHLVEGELRAALLQTELDFVRRLVRDIDDGALDGLDAWRAAYADHPTADQ